MKTMKTVHKTLFGAVVMSLACLLAFNANAADRDSRERDRGNYNPSTNHGDNNRTNHNDSTRNNNYDNNRNNSYDNNRNNHYDGNRNNYGSYGHNGSSSYYNGWYGNNNRFSFSGFWGGGSQRNWVEGYYETVCTKVLVSPAHTERRWVEPTYQGGYNGGPQRCVREGFWQDVFVPARYDDRQTRIWHPGYYRSY